MELDFNDLRGKIHAATSAMQASVIADEMDRNQRIAAAMARQSAERDATLIAGAEASVAQKDLLEQQLEIIREQNKLLLDNYEKLKELYDDQVQANKDTKEDLEKSRRFNRWMMIISIIAMLAAVASPIVTVWVSG